MVRNYKPKTTQNYNKEDLLSLADEFGKYKGSLRQFSLAKGIPLTTTRRWIKDTPKKIDRGRDKVLTEDEERLIETALLFLGDSNMPLDRDDIQAIVSEFIKTIERPCPFANNRPGIDWLRSFEKRHPEISKKRGEILTMARSKNMTPEVVNAFFDKYEKVVTENGLSLSPESIWNCDETGLNTDHRSKKVFVAKGKKDVYIKAANAGKTNYSVLVCGSAAGNLMAPYTVYKGKNLYDNWTKGGPTGAGYGVSSSGWMESANFEAWFQTMFVPAMAKNKKPILLLFDGHNSHITYPTVKSAQENDIILLCLPPHMSHRLQPLDVGFFRPFKILWRDELKSWARITKYLSVTKPIFPSLLKGAWEKATATSVSGGFKGAGLFPVDRQRILNRIQPDSTGMVQPGEPGPSTPSKNGGRNLPPTSELSPRRVLVSAITRVISPEATPAVETARLNARQKRHRVQALTGEILTEEASAARLQEEEMSQQVKCAQGKGKGKGKGKNKSTKGRYG